MTTRTSFFLQRMIYIKCVSSLSQSWRHIVVAVNALSILSFYFANIFCAVLMLIMRIIRIFIPNWILFSSFRINSSKIYVALILWICYTSSLKVSFLDVRILQVDVLFLHACPVLYFGSLRFIYFEREFSLRSLCCALGCVSSPCYDFILPTSLYDLIHLNGIY